MHVLLVEDDQLIAQGLVAGLELQGLPWITWRMRERLSRLCN